MSGVKRYQHIGSLVASNEAMRSLYPMATQYVLASDYDTLRTANQRLEGELERLGIEYVTALHGVTELRAEAERLEGALRVARKHVAYAADHCEQASVELDLIDAALAGAGEE